jgi:hypothetical protein
MRLGSSRSSSAQKVRYMPTASRVSTPWYNRNHREEIEKALIREGWGELVTVLQHAMSGDRFGGEK